MEANPGGGGRAIRTSFGDGGGDIPHPAEAHGDQEPREEQGEQHIVDGREHSA